jgi:hypothetical protein
MQMMPEKEPNRGTDPSLDVTRSLPFRRFKRFKRFKVLVQGSGSWTLTLALNWNNIGFRWKSN